MCMYVYIYIYVFIYIYMFVSYEEMESNRDLQEWARELGLVENLEADPVYPYLRWDNQQKKHVREQMAPLPHQEAKVNHQDAAELAHLPQRRGTFPRIAQAGSPARLGGDSFQPPESESQCLNAESQQFYQGVFRLCRNSVMQLCATSLRPAKMGRSPLAAQVDKMIQNI